MRHLLLGVLLLWPALASAADLSKIDRTIKKEPAYKGKPKCCLLVFGPEAKTKVWVVLDGDTLYVDRNGNGDLTDPGERLPCAKRQMSSPFEMSWFHAGGTGAYTHLVVASLALKRELVKSKRDKEFVQTKTGQELGRYCRFWIETGGHGQHAAVLLGDQPGAAPVIHFGGPLAVLPPDDLTLSPGKEAQLTAWVGTPGRGSSRDGKGVRTTTFCQPFERETGGSSIKVSSIPAEVHPVAEITFPSRRAGGKPITIRVVLRERC